MKEKLNIKNWNIGFKLTAAFIIIILAGIGITGYLSFNQASDALENSKREELTAIRKLKRDQIEEYFTKAVKNTRILADLEVVKENIQPLADAFEQGVRSNEYQNIANGIGEQLEYYKKEYEFYDLFLIDLDGNVIYSAEEEADFGTNLANGPYKDSGLAAAYQQGLNKVTLTDFSQYEPSSAPAAFLSAPVRNENHQVVGVVALQIPIDKINEIMAVTAGMGESGESYLIGEDRLMRSDSRFSDQSTILKEKIDTDAAREALAGNTGVERVTNYAGIEVISAYAPLDIQGQNWAMLVEVRRDEVMAPVNRLLKTILIVLGGVIVAAFLLTTFLVKGLIVNPVQKVQETLEDVSENDFSSKVQISSNDEIGQMASDLNETIEKLSSVLRQIQQAAVNVSNGANEISEGNQDLSQRTQEQSSSLEEVSATIEEITSAIQEIAENSEEADDLSDQTMDAVQEGSEVIDDTMGSMKKINASSKEIAEIITTVNDIAFQTNLLALNAAVEAARAGEHGKGFAVVAAEVRNLASRTADSAEEIEDLITTVIDQIEEGNELVEDTGEALDEIIENSRQTAEAITEIAASMEEQSSAANQMQGAVEELDQTTQQNASMVEEIASASESLDAEARDMSEIVKQFKLNGKNNSQHRIINKRKTKNKKQSSKKVEEDYEQGIEELEENMDMDFDEGDFEKF